MTRIIQNFAEISGDYDAAFVDLWGCVHNGITAYPAAVTALQTYRAAGGKVVLLTNAPRPRAFVEAQIKSLGVPEDAWDAVATSGDSARLALHRGIVGQKVHFIGEDRDLSFFDPLAVDDHPLEITRVPLDAAEGIVCTGPADPHAPPDQHKANLLHAKARGLKLLCANPDIVVDRGDHREWCAGAVAQLYTEMGGESLYFGKPYPPIYELARTRLTQATGLYAEESRIVALGDGLVTDIAGALGEGLDAVFITGGLAARDTATGPSPDGQPEPERLAAVLAEAQMGAAFAMGYLR